MTKTETLLKEIEVLGQREIGEVTQEEWQDYNQKVKELLEHMQKELEEKQSD